ncbi:hypothetical protein LUZ60_015746 [Juncus effusus]|nr:hypothetical protein LUZ60_015746 [Juncus effusus]
MAKSLGFIILILTLTVLTINTAQASHGWECGKYVKELLMPDCPISNGGPDVPPSENCCSDIQAVDMYCICLNIPDDVRDQICVEKLVSVAAQCNKPLEPGTHCGGKKDEII